MFCTSVLSGSLAEEGGVRKFWQARTEGVARKPEKKKKEVQINRQELTVGLGKRKN